MSYIPTDFRTALELDMERMDMLEKDLGAKLGVSQQSISKWKARNFPPLYRVKDLVAVLGSESFVAKLDLPNMLANTPRIRIAEPSKELGPPRLPRAAVEAPRQESTGIDESFRATLPGALHANISQPGPLLAGRHIRVDYASDKLVLIAKTQSNPQPSAALAPQVLALAAARAAAAAAPDSASKTFAVAIVPQGDACCTSVEHLLPPSLRESAKALGIEIWMCNDTRDLAARISALEGVKVVPAAVANLPAYEDEMFV